VKRYVIVPIDNDDVTDIGVVELDMDSGTTSRGLYHLSAPPDNQLTLSLEKAIAILEMGGFPRRKRLTAPLRAAFGLSEGSES